jgi:hypothetical protein
MKTIKLKESDLYRIVKRVLNEQKAGDKVSGAGQWMNTDQFDAFMEGLFKNGPIHTTAGKFKKYKNLKDSLLWNNSVVFKLSKGIVGVTTPSRLNDEASFKGAMLMAKGAGFSGVTQPAELFFYQEEDNNRNKKIFYCVVVPCTAKTCI